jgi:hypothetical protein
MDSVPDDRTLRAIPRVAELIARADALLITAGGRPAASSLCRTWTGSSSSRISIELGHR